MMKTFDVFEVKLKSREGGGNALGSIGDIIKKNRLDELNEVKAEEEIERQRAKLAGYRKDQFEAQSLVADKLMPQGFWGFLSESLKDRQPSSAITVQDIVALVDKFSQRSQVQAQPDTGMWGFLTAIMQQHNTPLTVADITSLIDRYRDREAPPPAPSALSQLSEFAQTVKTIRDVFAPAPSVQPSFPIDLGEGKSVPWDVLKDFTDHQFNLTLKKEDHDERVKTMRTVRENVSPLIDMGAKFADALRNKGSQPSPPPAPAANQWRQFICPDCQLEFHLPADMTEGACPRCAMEQLKAISSLGQNLGQATTEVAQVVSDSTEEG